MMRSTEFPQSLWMMYEEYEWLDMNMKKDLLQSILNYIKNTATNASIEVIKKHVINQIYEIEYMPYLTLENNRRNIKKESTILNIVEMMKSAEFPQTLWILYEEFELLDMNMKKDILQTILKYIQNTATNASIEVIKKHIINHIYEIKYIEYQPYFTLKNDRRNIDKESTTKYNGIMKEEEEESNKIWKKIREYTKATERERLKIRIASEGLTCPITHDIMIDPIILKCGHVYEKSSIKRWLVNSDTCPLCRAHTDKYYI